MKITMNTDTKEFERAMKEAEFDEAETREVLHAGGMTIKNRQVQLVPVRTGDTKKSIDIFDTGPGSIEVGPTTPYADVIEFGRSDREYPVQPFVRPSVAGRGPAIQGQMTKKVNEILRRKGLS